MTQEGAGEKPPRSRIYISLEELSSRQRGAVLGLLKEMGFAPGEIEEVVVQIPEEGEDSRYSQQRGRKRK